MRGMISSEDFLLLEIGFKFWGRESDLFLPRVFDDEGASESGMWSRYEEGWARRS